MLHIIAPVEQLLGAAHRELQPDPGIAFTTWACFLQAEIMNHA